MKNDNPDMKDANKLDIPSDELGNGPVMNRSCTDVLICCLFLVFIVGMVGASGYGFLNGDPKILLTVWDLQGNGCGYSEATLNYPYAYWPGLNPSEMMTGGVDMV